MAGRLAYGRENGIMEPSVINERSIRAISSSCFGDSFVAPLCDSYSFGRVPETILGLFDGKFGRRCLPLDTVKDTETPARKVVVLFIDALGWCFVKDALQTHPFLKRFAEQGVVSQLTAQFPSTTSVHVSTMHTGVPLAKHGIPEFRYLEPKVGDIINPFKFGLQRDAEPEGLKGKIKASSIYPRASFYSKLNARNIRSHIFLSPKAVDGTYTASITKGASARYVFEGVSAGVDALIATVHSENERGYFYFYYDGIDKAAHKFGPDSTETRAEIKSVLDALEKLNDKGILNESGTATVLLADHGQISVDTRQSIFVDVIYPEINQHLLTGTDGKPMAPGGSPRDLFLYTKPESTEVVFKELGARLGEKALVCRTSELLKKGIFGKNPSNALLSRLPSLIVLAKGHNTFWVSTDVKKDKYKLGHHGGMSPEEMIVPCMTLQG
jgi:hypothetical protein